MVSNARDPTMPVKLATKILKVQSSNLTLTPTSGPLLHGWTLDMPATSQEAQSLQTAAQDVLETDIPVAFPTETVYGLGADATRSAAVKGIFQAKQRPPDNPLIVHVHSLPQLRALMQPAKPSDVPISMRKSSGPHLTKGSSTHPISSFTGDDDPIPRIYRSLIERFWPGPLTLIMPNASSTPLAPEVTAGLQTFGVRMPQNVVALALLKLTDVPLAAPSANASTKPSPTTAQHVLNDLDGRISTIIDGGPCTVGVESTVVDGLSNPPLVLRPGGVSIEELKTCDGWENVAVGYKDRASAETKPRAPGMKYKHYSPRATVVLYEVGSRMPQYPDVRRYIGNNQSIGLIRTSSWPVACGIVTTEIPDKGLVESPMHLSDFADSESTPADELAGKNITLSEYYMQLNTEDVQRKVKLFDVALGGEAGPIAQRLFAALRALDFAGVDVIFVEGVDETHGDVAVAVMNRLRKASEVDLVK